MKDFDKVRDKKGYLIPSSINFKREAANVKEVLRQAQKKIVYKSQVATREAL